MSPPSRATAAADITPYDRLAWTAREVEDLLARGQRKRELLEFFGSQSYAELTKLAEAAAASRRQGARRQRRRVWIVPGIMGSKLGRRRSGGQPADVLWLDALDIIIGRLTELRVPLRAIAASGSIVALGTLLQSYLRLWLRLAAAGYEPEFFDYDWRADVREIGVQFGQRLASDREPSLIVAHSMGGLVARAALALPQPADIARLVLLGTPNFGAFAAVQALRGTYGVVRKLALLDLRHDAAELASGVFSSFPSLYQMLPQGRLAGDIDLFDDANWPSKGPRPDPRLLIAAAGIESDLAPASERFVTIIGSGEHTIESAARRGDEFSYTFTLRGDGTVPVRSAELPGATAYYASASHSGLIRNASITRGIVDLLRDGTTSELATALPRRAAARFELTDTELRQQQKGKIDWASLSSEQRREFLENLNDPPPLAGAETLEVREPPAQIEIVIGDIAEADTAAVAASLFANVTPHGAIAALDARLDGVIAEFRWRRILGTEAGRVSAVPAMGRLGDVQAVLLVGLGSFDQLQASLIEIAAENVGHYCARSALDSLTTVLWGAGSGLAPEASFEAQVRGFLRAPRLRRLVIRVQDRATLEALRERAAMLATESGVQIRLPRAQPASKPSPKKTAPIPRTARRTAYLLMQANLDSTGKEVWRAAVLNSDSPAAIVAESQSVSKRGLDVLLRKLDAPAFGPKVLAQIGSDLPELLLHPNVRAALRGNEDAELVIVHDAPSSRVPWETIRFGRWIPALGRGLSRRYAAEQLAVARLSESRRADPELHVLLVANPTDDLPGAELERERLEALLRPRAGLQLTTIAGRAATRARVLAEFKSGDYDVLHYAGHAFFDADAPASSGLVCSDANLTGADLRGLQRAPSLVVLNACESGRIRRTEDKGSRRGAARRAASRALDDSAGVAEMLLRAGVASFVGTYWPVGDAAASEFANRFYSKLLENRTLGEAVLAGRQRVKAQGSADWADYLHFGDPEFRLKGLA